MSQHEEATKRETRAVMNAQQQATTKPSARSRRARPPRRQIYAIVPPGLFAFEDIHRICAKTEKDDPGLKAKTITQIEMIQILQHLDYTFQVAVLLDQWSKSDGEPERGIRWYRQVSKQASGLLKTLSLNSSEYQETSVSGIDDFRNSIDCMMGLGPHLPVKIDHLAKLAALGPTADVSPNETDPAGHHRLRQEASDLVRRLPGTIALIVALADWKSAQLKQNSHGRGERRDELRHHLFKLLAHAHYLIFGRKPRTRGKDPGNNYGSMKWAKAIVGHACDKIAATNQEAAVPYIRILREITDQSDISIANLLEDGWKSLESTSTAP
jgi:hypothetical protein